MRDADATLIVTDESGLAVSKGTALAAQCAEKYGKPLLVIDVGDTEAAARAAAWIDVRRRTHGAELTVGIGGPRDSEAPGIQAKAKTVIGAILGRICGAGSR